MPYTKSNADSELPATGGMILRTIANAHGTFTLEFTATDTAGKVHPTDPPARFSSTAAAAWIANAIATPGTSAAIDAPLVTYPSFTAADLAAARQALFIYCIEVGLGFTPS